jgi:hypothetical protein
MRDLGVGFACLDPAVASETLIGFVHANSTQPPPKTLKYPLQQRRLARLPVPRS